MIKDFENKNVLAEMKRQVNEAAKISIREARITFVLVHMMSEHHELISEGSKTKDKDIMLRFASYNLTRAGKWVEGSEEDGIMSPVELYRKEDSRFDLLDLFRHLCPAKDAVKKGLDEWQEWPDDVPYFEWYEDILQTAYTTLFGLYYFDTPVKDMLRWLGKDEPKNPRFVNAMNRHETVVNIDNDHMKLNEMTDEPERKKKRVYVSDEEIAQGMENVEELKDMFRKLAGMLAKDDTLRFCQEKEETAFGIFMIGTFAMMMPGDNVNREGMTKGDNAKLGYQMAKKTMMGKKLTSQIVTADDDKAACEVFHWGLVYGRMGVEDGSMPTDLAYTDVRRKPGPKSKK